MISEQDKKAILDGVLARTNNNKKAKFILKSEHEANFNYPYLFLISDKDKCYTDWYNEHLNSKQDKFNSSIVELWKDKQEPFDLERALTGEFFIHKNKPDIKCRIVGKSYFNSTFEHYIVESEDSKIFTCLVDTLNIYYAMYKEPEPVSNKVTLTLPCPLKEPRKHMWYISAGDTVCKSSYKENEIYKFSQDKERFEAGFYFGSEADAQAWLDALKNNRR